jgi:hypothetical protein
LSDNPDIPKPPASQGADKMIILNDLTNLEIELNTSLGKEKAIYFLGWSFLMTNSYKSLKEAIAACRRDLDVGLFSIVVENICTKEFSLWCPVPKELISHG